MDDKRIGDKKVVNYTIFIWTVVGGKTWDIDVIEESVVNIQKDKKDKEGL